MLLDRLLEVGVVGGTMMLYAVMYFAGVITLFLIIMFGHALCLASQDWWNDLAARHIPNYKEKEGTWWVFLIGCLVGAALEYIIRG